MSDLSARGMAAGSDPALEAELAGALGGFSLADAQHLLQQTVLGNGGLSGKDLPRVRAAKMELLDSDGVLELVPATAGTLDRVAGLASLKHWLELRGRAIGSERAHEIGLDAPRGILLTGVPGCGKSLVAKTLAATWGRPLLLLDPARIYRKYVGESEQRLEAALLTAEAMAPAVLWIDEIEKSFATGGKRRRRGFRAPSGHFPALDAGLARRRVPGGHSQRRRRPAPRVPPQRALRRGVLRRPARPAARQAVFEVQLSARRHDPACFDLAALSAATEGFARAEIEAVVVGALYRAFAASADLTSGDLLAETASVFSLSVSRAEEIAALSAWAAERTVPAD